MYVEIPKSENEKNVEAVRRAAEAKKREVDEAHRKLVELKAEERGLIEALKVLGAEGFKAE